MKIQKMAVLILICFFMLGCSSGAGDTSPRSIDPTLDICPVCRMSIVDMHFAAQVINSKKQVESFDDIGCLALYLKRMEPDWKTQGLTIYVKDFNTMEWVLAEEATYTHGRIDTPMSFGIVAFSTSEAAGEFAARTESRMLAWPEIFEVKQTVGFEAPAVQEQTQ
ncbi:MAG: nitrous oxide reductase accessory protein NosL [Bacillota bacterium]